MVWNARHRTLMSPNHRRRARILTIRLHAQEDGRVRTNTRQQLATVVRYMYVSSRLMSGSLSAVVPAPTWQAKLQPDHHRSVESTTSNSQVTPSRKQSTSTQTFFPSPIYHNMTTSHQITSSSPKCSGTNQRSSSSKLDMCQLKQKPRRDGIPSHGAWVHAKILKSGLHGLMPTQ